MLKFLKTLFLSNKYSLLVVLILSLWLKIAKDYNIFLSYLILILLYLIVGILVEMVLDKFFPNFNGPLFSRRYPEEETEEDFSEEEENEMEAEATAAYAGKDPERRYSARSVETQRKAVPEAKAPVRRSGVDTAAIEKRAQRLSERGVSDAGRDDSQLERTPKVTSSYIKNAGGIPRDVEKKLIRTAANFHSIQQNSEGLDTGERLPRRVYGNAKNPFVDDLDDLYTNKKDSAKAEPKSEPVKNEPEPETIGTVPVEEEKTDPRPSRRAVSYEAVEYEQTATPDELNKVSEDISREVERRVNEPRATRRTKIVLHDEFEEEDASLPKRPVRPDLYSQQRREPLVKSERRAADPSADKVSADMDKIDRLFNRNRAASEEEESQNDSGLLGRFKKKRR